MKSSNACGRTAPQGFTLVEIAISVALLAIAMTLTVRVLGWIAAERAAADRRLQATQVVANAMERLTARSWERVSAEAAKSVEMPEDLRRTLKDGELTVDVGKPGSDGSKRISVRLRWRNRAGEWNAPVRLTSWIYPEAGGSR